MIRRLFWLTAGALLGITGYRRLASLARSVSPAARAAGLARFAADVREGMDLYMERQAGSGPSTLGNHRGGGQTPGPPGGRRALSPDNHVKDGR